MKLVLAALLVASAAACSGGTHAATTAVAASSPPVAPPVAGPVAPPVAAAAEPTPEEEPTPDETPPDDDTPCDTDPYFEPGNHDRVLFVDEKSDRSGYQTKAGKVVIKAKYIDASEFSPGGIAAVVDGVTPMAFIDTHGKIIAKAYAFDNGPDYFQEGLARYVDSAGKIGFLDTSGRFVIPAQYDGALAFCHGHTDVKVGTTSFTIDATGKRL